MAVSAGAKSVAVVLVHGGFVDGSGWEGVYKILKKHGYNVSIVQNTTHRWPKTWQPRNTSSQSGTCPSF